MTKVELSHLKERIDFYLNSYLCEMKEGYDDSITGYNDAWEIIQHVFKDELEALNAQTIP